MKIKINFPPLALAVVAGLTAYLTATEAIDAYVPFAAENNAGAFMLLTGMMTIFAAAAAFERIEN